MDEHTNTFTEGQILLINKPLYWTSFEVVKKIRFLTKTKKVGHSGTLDPLATGLLIICTGKYTKRISEFMAQEKEYTGTITLGATTPTFDRETDPKIFKSIEHINEEQMQMTAQFFTGNIMQVPPIHSAIKKDGRRAYESARKGIDIKLEPREITIHEFSIEKIDLPMVYFKVVCSTGTYIRSLANDFGAQLGCGGYLSSLCRTRIGSFLNSEAKTIEQFEMEMNEMNSI